MTSNSQPRTAATSALSSSPARYTLKRPEQIHFTNINSTKRDAHTTIPTISNGKQPNLFSSEVGAGEVDENEERGEATVPSSASEASRRSVVVTKSSSSKPSSSMHQLPHGASMTTKSHHHRHHHHHHSTRRREAEVLPQQQQHWSVFYPRGIPQQKSPSLHYLHIGSWATTTCDYYLHRPPKRGEVKGNTVSWLHNAHPRDRFVFLVEDVEVARPDQATWWGAFWMKMYGIPPAFAWTREKRLWNVSSSSSSGESEVDEGRTENNSSGGGSFEEARQSSGASSINDRIGVGNRGQDLQESVVAKGDRGSGCEVVEILHKDITAIDYQAGLQSNRLALEVSVATTYWFPSKVMALEHYGLNLDGSSAANAAQTCYPAPASAVAAAASTTTSPPPLSVGKNEPQNESFATSRNNAGQANTSSADVSPCTLRPEECTVTPLVKGGVVSNGSGTLSHSGSSSAPFQMPSHVISSSISASASRGGGHGGANSSSGKSRGTTTTVILSHHQQQALKLRQQQEKFEKQKLLQQPSEQQQRPDISPNPIHHTESVISTPAGGMSDVDQDDDGGAETGGEGDSGNIFRKGGKIDSTISFANERSESSASDMGVGSPGMTPMTQLFPSLKRETTHAPTASPPPKEDGGAADRSLHSASVSLESSKNLFSIAAESSSHNNDTPDKTGVTNSIPPGAGGSAAASPPNGQTLRDYRGEVAEVHTRRICNTMVIAFSQDPHFNAVLRELLLPERTATKAVVGLDAGGPVVKGGAGGVTGVTGGGSVVASTAGQPIGNGGDSPPIFDDACYTLSVKEQKRLLSLYETGMPSWTVFFARWGIFYRRWFRILVVSLINLWPIIALAVGLYDLYKHLDTIRDFLDDYIRPFNVWIESHFSTASLMITYSVSVVLTMLQSMVMFLKGLGNFFTVVSAPIQSILTVLALFRYPILFLWTFVSVTLGPIFQLIMTFVQLFGSAIFSPFRAVGSFFSLILQFAPGSSAAVSGAAQSTSVFMTTWKQFQFLWDKVLRPLKNVLKACYDGLMALGVAIARREASLRRWYMGILSAVYDRLDRLLTIWLQFVTYNLRCIALMVPPYAWSVVFIFLVYWTSSYWYGPMHYAVYGEYPRPRDGGGRKGDGYGKPHNETSICDDQRLPSSRTRDAYCAEDVRLRRKKSWQKKLIGGEVEDINTGSIFSWFGQPVVSSTDEDESPHFWEQQGILLSTLQSDLKDAILLRETEEAESLQQEEAAAAAAAKSIFGGGNYLGDLVSWWRQPEAQSQEGASA